MKRIQLGDIIVAHTKRGDAFIQVMGRGLFGGFDVMRTFQLGPPPADLHELMDRPTGFWFLGLAFVLLEREEFSLAGNVAIPDNVKIPMFRGESNGPASYVIGPDGVVTALKRGLDIETRKLPINVGIPPVRVIAQIENEWTPEKDFANRMNRTKLPRLKNTKRPLRRRIFYTASTEQTANLLAGDLAGRGFDTKVQMSETDWEIEVSFEVSDNAAANEKAEAACSIVAERIGASFLASEQDI